MAITIKSVVIAGALSLLASAPAGAVVISATTNPTEEGVFDSDPDSAASAFGTRTVAFGAGDLAGGTPFILDVDITIDFMKCDDDSAQGVTLTTPLPAACPQGPGGVAFANEIIFRLTSPNGTEVSLVELDSYSGAAEGARITVKFDDAAAQLVGSTGFVGGDFYTGEPLSNFNSESVIGTWELYIEDRGGGDPLGFASFTLDITLADPTAAPEPGTALLFGFGLAGLAALRRRRT